VIANSRSIAASDDPGVAAVAGDIADPGTAEHLVTTAVERFGRVDTLVNNAGVFVAKPFTEYTEADYAYVTGVNLTGFFHLTQRVIAQMLSQGDGGHVVNVTTTLVEHADARVPSALASLTKGGLAAATKSLAIEYARKGIRVNAISPGTIDTPMHADDDPAALAALHPLGRIAASTTSSKECFTSKRRRSSPASSRGRWPPEKDPPPHRLGRAGHENALRNRGPNRFRSRRRSLTAAH
jgi:NAD(P)-dependent dehydrogenase (short-subunit alcohol dehydrogenase family)